jgi:NAD(P)-dependent dehydrogenase (short-subunit alcohol dehydrogenase family)
VGSEEVIALVTGSTDGIGRETARVLASKGWDVIVHGRTPAKARAAGDRWVAGDFESLAEVRAMAASVARMTDRLDALIDNAGILARARAKSRDGHEITIAVNHLAPFLLTNLLLPLVEKASGRIVIVSSQVHASGQLPEDLDELDRLTGFEAYCASKLANVLHANELARRTKVVVNSLHPGVIGTKLGYGGGPVEEGAYLPVLLATDLSLAGVTGAYFSGRGQRTASAAARDEKLAKKLWDWSVSRTS